MAEVVDSAETGETETECPEEASQEVVPDPMREETETEITGETATDQGWRCQDHQ